MGSKFFILKLPSALLLTLSVFSSWANSPEADRLVWNAQQTERNIRSTAFRLNLTQINQINLQLDQINRILFGNPGGGDSKRLLCVARDSDGREPYQIAVLIDPVRSKKIPGTVMTLSDCQRAISNARNFAAGKHLLCGTRDNDGRPPFAFILLNAETESAQVLKNAFVYGSNDECDQQLQTARQFFNPSGLATCASRDSDGRSPYIKAFIEETGNITKGSDVYGTLEECRAAL